MGVTDRTGMDAGTGNGIAQPQQTPWGGYPTPREIAAAGMFEGVSPHQFTTGINVMSRQLGNRTLMHWVGQLYPAGQNGDTHAGTAQGLQGVNRPLTRVPTDGVLQLMLKKQKNTGKPLEEKAAGETPKATSETGMATVPEPQAASSRAEPAMPATPGEKKKKKKPRVQVALNTLRAEGLEEFKGYIEAQIGEPELLRTLVERIGRARDLGDKKDRALRTVEMRMGALAHKSIPATQQAAPPGQGRVSEKAEAAPVRITLNKRENELFDSCFKGNAGRLKHLLRFGNIDINMATPDGTLLCIAAYHGHTAVVRELLSIRGIDVNLAQRGGTTPLYFAAQEGHVEIVRLLSETRGVNVNLLTSEGAAPLHIAAQKGHEPVIRVFLANPKTNVNVRKPSGSTPLLIAAQKNFPGIVELLIERGANVNLGLSVEGSVPLIIAAIANHVAVVRLLTQAPGIKVNMVTQDGVTALCAAAQEGNEEIVRLLLSKGADPGILSYNGTGPLILACIYRHTAILKMLLNAGADVESQVRVPGGEKFTVYGIAWLMDYSEAVALLEAYSHNKPAQATRLEKLAPEDELQWSTPPTTPPPVWSTPPTTPPPDWLTLPVAITPDWSTTPTTTEAFPPPYAMRVTQPGESASASVAAVVPGEAGTGTMEPSDTAPVTTVPESPAPAVPGSGPTRADIQSPLGTAKNALVQEVLKKLDNNTLEPLEGIRLMMEARAAADMDTLCMLYNRLASTERQRERSRRRPARREVTSALPQAMQQGADFPDYVLEDRVYRDADSIEDGIKKHLEQSCHRFVSQVLNDMEFGRGKPTTGYPDLLHASAGIPGVGSCSVFYYRDAARQLIRIVGIGHHLDQETYRLNYASRPLGKRGHILRFS